ncbi:hypothetical protein IRJ41_021976 [Triplophysa rosa]|uniref:Uncharacterized protein n=1 Tax=Triplophysa rosa TaxID=992332 RepID=A0A9W7T5K6_TRIRA|nr:hypothetical protein IRJ41_021976 [Triplophysa rosa]
MQRRAPEIRLALLFIGQKRLTDAVATNSGAFIGHSRFNTQLPIPLRSSENKHRVLVSCERTAIMLLIKEGQFSLLYRSSHRAQQNRGQRHPKHAPTHTHAPEGRGGCLNMYTFKAQKVYPLLQQMRNTLHKVRFE